MPWCSTPPVIRSSSARPTSSTGTPRSAARRTASATRSSGSRPCATYSAVVGICARSASTTGLRPTSSSGDSPRARAGLRAAFFAAAVARRCAGCPLRASAGGVGPRPSSPRRRCPPEPTTAPFLLPVPRRAPRRCELPAISRPSCLGAGLRRPRRSRSSQPREGSRDVDSTKIGGGSWEGPARAGGGVLDHDAGRGEPVPDRVGGRVVLAGAGLLPLVERDAAPARPPPTSGRCRRSSRHGSASGSRPRTPSIARTSAVPLRHHRLVPRGERGVALADRAVHHRQRLRHRRGRRPSRTANAAGSGARPALTDQLGGPGQEALDPPVAGRRLGQRLLASSPSVDR